jgi:CRP/FNR family transcriptional regulator
MARIATSVDSEVGRPVVSEGEPADHVFNVISGWLKVFKLLSDGRRQITGFLAPGDFLGLTHNDTYAYSAEAVTPVGLCRFPRKKLEALLEELPDLEHRLLSRASHEIAAAQDQMLLLGRKTATEKIASFLLLLSRRAADRGQPENPIELPMSRNDIGDFLGLTTETVSRTVTQLKTKQVIKLLEGHRVQLTDVDRLRRLSEGE